MGSPRIRMSPTISSSRAATWPPGFAAAEVVVEREFDTSMVHQGYIEPHNAVAQYSSDGQSTIWVSTQGAFYGPGSNGFRARYAAQQDQGHSRGNRAAVSGARFLFITSRLR